MFRRGAPPPVGGSPTAGPPPAGVHGHSTAARYHDPAPGKVPPPPVVEPAACSTSTCLAFLAWLPPFGLCGAHLCATRRYRHAFLHASTCGFAGLGWLSDLLRVASYAREANSEDGAKQSPRWLSPLVTAYLIARLYVSILSASWDFAYEAPPRTAGADFPALADPRSWETSVWQVGALSAVAVGAAGATKLSFSMQPDQTTSFLGALGGAAVAIALGVVPPGTDVSELSTTTGRGFLAGCTLPNVAAIGAAVVGVALVKPRSKAGLSSVRARVCASTCSVAVSVVGFWTACLLILAASQMTVTVDKVVMRLPKECRGVRGLAVGVEGAGDAFVLPAWHADEYAGHLAGRCRARREAQDEHGSGSPTLQHSIKLGPLVFSNHERVGRLVADSWKQVQREVKAGGGWGAFVGSIVSHVRGSGASDSATLGVKEGASLLEVKKAYRDLAKKVHPDKLPPDASAEERESAQQRFEKISAAHDRLVAKIKEA